ncbi:MAG: DNA double-strand break repair nuclease NurA [archaeon]
MKRTGELLRVGAEAQVDDSRSRFEAAKVLYDRLLQNLIVSDFSFGLAHEVASKFFGGPKAKYAAIDGSMDQVLTGGLAVFWGGAYAATGEAEFRKDSPPKVSYETGFVGRGRGVSSCVPVYVDRVQDVDQTVREMWQRGESTVTKPLTEEGVVDNSTIASWIMSFSEFYLAYQMVAAEDVRILLLDRSLSSTRTSLMYDTSRKQRWKTDCAICDFEVDGTPFDANDIELARHRIINEGLGTPTPRGDELRYSIIYLLERLKKPLTFKEICVALGINEEDREKRAERLLSRSVTEGFLVESGGRYSLNPRYADSWDRTKKLVLTVGRQLFEDQCANPMRIKRGDEERWLTTRDLAMLTLFVINMLMEACWAKGCLLIGITKDTTARDFRSHVIPVCVGSGIWKVEGGEVGTVPTTDRMLLQAVSMLNHDKVRVPWSLIEYDAAFQMIVPDFQNRPGYVSGAVRNRIIPERLFAKTYVQLDAADRDPMLRSNVLFVDRLAYPGFDRENTLSFKHDYAAVEPVQPIFYKDNSVRNEAQNLVMVLLKAMSARSIPEVFGHNKPMFIADKIAKEQRQRIRGVVEATGLWLANNPRLRKFSFYMNTFRERRAEVEYARRS